MIIFREEVTPDRMVLDSLLERVRSAHKSDVDSCTVFWMLGVAYVSTNPDKVEATNIFRLVSFLSLSTSLAWLGRDKNMRMVCWLGGMGVNLVMGGRVLQCLWEAL